VRDHRRPVCRAAWCGQRADARCARPTLARLAGPDRRSPSWTEASSPSCARRAVRPSGECDAQHSARCRRVNGLENRASADQGPRSRRALQAHYYSTLEKDGAQSSSYDSSRTGRQHDIATSSPSSTRRMRSKFEAGRSPPASRHNARGPSDVKGSSRRSATSWAEATAESERQYAYDIPHCNVGKTMYAWVPYSRTSLLEA
jgi:hypothetical protein